MGLLQLLTNVILDLLRSIPAEARKWVLLGFAIVAAVVLGLEEWTDIALGPIPEILLGVGSYLGLQSAANVRDVPETEPELIDTGDEHDHDLA